MNSDKKDSAKRKIDLRFVLIVSVLIIIITVISLRTDFSYSSKDLPDSYEAAFSKLIISEVVSSNKGVYASKNNEVCDYIEIYNGTDRDIDLRGYGLSDETDKIKWLFTDSVIPAKSYLVVDLTGNDSGDPLEANFKLSASGSERVILVNPEGKIIDAVDTVSMEANTSLSRDENGGWYICAYCTPGFENSADGLEQYLASLSKEEEECVIVINEFLARNKGNFINEKENDCGEVEIKNISDKTVDLSQYFISDDASLPFAKRLPEVFLGPGEIYVLHCGDGSYYEEDYLDFNFPSGYGTIVLSRNGKIVQELDYSGLNNGDCLCYENGEYQVTSTVSIGYENDADGIASFQKKYLQNKIGLLISEVNSSNFSYLPQNGNEYYDYIELYNNSSEEINLSDYCLSDDDGDPYKYNLPDIVLGPQEYFIVMCSGDTRLTNDAYYHSSFTIGDNDSVYLFKDGKMIDGVHIGNVPAGYSYGRGEEEGFYYMLPSPMEKNNEGYGAFLPLQSSRCLAENMMT